MERQIMWSHLETPGMEHFRITMHADVIVADGIVLGLENGSAFRLHYEIRCDAQWRVRQVQINLLNDGRRLRLSSNGQGLWFDESDRVRSEFDGCLDVDITATPFTNTLPIRRLPWKQGESADIKVVYFKIPEMQVTLDEQRYTFVGVDGAGSRYRFEQRSSGFTAEVWVDADGLVEHYPELFRRVWAR